MKIGFIGVGNMGKAMISGILRKGLYGPEDLLGFDAVPEVLDAACGTLGIRPCPNARELAMAADIIVLSVKPQDYEVVIPGIREFVDDKKIIITIAPGKTIGWLEGQFGRRVKIVRTMPNTPAMVLEGCTGVCTNAVITEEETEQVLEILGCFGKAFLIREKLMDVVVGISGSLPAYVFMFVEAVADAAVERGMPRKQAYQFIEQAVLGSAKLLQETGKHPGEMKDIVCSPGGTAIQGVRVLEEKGFRGALIDALDACIDRAAAL